jgi:hypothetical protein
LGSFGINGLEKNDMLLAGVLVLMMVVVGFRIRVT